MKHVSRLRLTAVLLHYRIDSTNYREFWSDTRLEFLSFSLQLAVSSGGAGCSRESFAGQMAGAIVF
jgi:hypothetical protein